MPKSPREYLKHILDEIEYLTNVSADLTRDAFLRDETLKRAFVRSIEVIGEATKKVAPEFERRYLDVEWRAIAGMRNRLIHGYFAVDYEIVWDVVTNKVPELREKIETILQRDRGGVTPGC